MDKSMENNEQAQEEQNTATSAEQTEDTNNSAEDTKDWKAEALKFKAIAERKDKKLQTQSQQETVQSNQTNEPSGEFREELIMIAQGRSREEVDTLKVIAKGKGISLAEAEKDPMFANVTGATKAAETKQRAQLGASNSGVVQTQQTGDRASDRAQQHAEMLRKFGDK